MKDKLEGKSGPEIVRLMRLCHPDDHGEPYTRSEVMRECKRRGKKLLDEIGWPSDPEAVYFNLHTDAEETLKQVTSMSALDGFRHILHESEEKLRKVLLENCILYPDKNTGIECTTLKEWRVVMKKCPRVKEALTECIRLHKGFYEILGCHEGYEPTEISERPPISKIAVKSALCESNICSIARWLGLDVDTPESLESLPKPDIYLGVWNLVEDWTPIKEEQRKSLLSKVMRRGGQATLEIFG